MKTDARPDFANGLFLIFLAAVATPWLAGIEALAQEKAPTKSAASPEVAPTNYALILDGKTGSMEVSDTPWMHSLSNAMTLELWFKPTSFDSQQGSVNSLLRKNAEAGKENFFVRFRTMGGKQLVEVTPGLGIGILRAPCEIELNRWYHLAATYDGKMIRAFLNGAELANLPGNGQIQIDDSDLLAGRGDPEYSSGEFFNGAMDEIRIWNVARTEADIRSAMNSRLVGNEPGLVTCWNFDDGTPRDVSGHGHEGRLKGQASIALSAREPLSPARAEARHPPKVEKTDPDKWQGILEELWTRLSDIYPALEYKGISGKSWIEPAANRARQAASQEEFYSILLELMASLRDTHTRIVSYPGQPVLRSPPVFLNRVEGKTAVIRASASTGLSPGDTLQTIEGKPIEECLNEHLKRVCNSTERGRAREACSRLLAGTPGTTVAITVMGADHKTREVKLRRESDPTFQNEPAVSSRKLGESVGCIRISRWGGEGLVGMFDRALEEFKDLPGLIIDVRGNGGGDDQLADQVNGRLIEKPVVSSIDFWRKEGSDQYRRTIGWVQPRGPWKYSGRVAVLIDEGCASACEHFVSGIEAMGHVLLVGLPTNGAGGGPTGVQLSDGTQVRISRALGLRANGVVFEGHGIPPHIESAPTLVDLRTNRDAALELAKEWVLSNRPVPDRAGLFSVAHE